MMREGGGGGVYGKDEMKKILVSFFLRCPMEYVGANAFAAPAVMDGSVRQKAFPGATVGCEVMVTNFFLSFESVFGVISEELHKRAASRGYIPPPPFKMHVP